MKEINARLKERAHEFGVYLRHLKHVENQLKKPNTGNKRRGGDLPTGDVFISMKAACFLMLYNLVETTIRASMAEIYNVIRQQKCALRDVSEHLQDVWINQRFWLAPHEATPATYRDRAARMLRETMSGQALALKADHLPIGGNINADVLRKLCKDHGVTLQAPKQVRGGVELQTIREQRNALAHGDKSFIECGREFAISDVYRIAKECLRFIRAFVVSVERFIKTGGYRWPTGNRG